LSPDKRLNLDARLFESFSEKRKETIVLLLIERGWCVAGYFSSWTAEISLGRVGKLLFLEQL
jgi:hypothetical protein